MVKNTKSSQKTILTLVAGSMVWVVLGYCLTVLLMAAINQFAGKSTADSIGVPLYGMFGFLASYWIVVWLMSLPRDLKQRMTQIGKFSAWTMTVFFFAQFLIGILLSTAAQLGADFSTINEALFGAVVAAASYVISLLIVIGVPWLVRRHSTTREDVGLQRLPTWAELGLAPAGMIVYFITSAIVIYVVSQLIPSFDVSQAQDVGFTQLSQRSEYILAFLTLVVIAPFAEELLFRGYLYGKLQKYLPWWGAAVITSVLFGLAHGQWNVAIDTFILGMFLASLRTLTGSLWPSILLHMIKNGIAYYFLFINPTFINTLGG